MPWEVCCMLLAGCIVKLLYTLRLYDMCDISVACIQNPICWHVAGVQAFNTLQRSLAGCLLSISFCTSGQLLHLHLCVPCVHESAVPCMGPYEEV